MFSHTARIGLVVAAATLLAACSAGPTGPQVAALGSSTTTASAAGGPSGSNSMASNALQYSQCMRSHGVKNFPDPQISGNSVSIRIAPGSGVNKSDPTFQSAQKSCQKYLQAGIAGSGKQADPTKISAWAACMRSHGLPNFPDPTIDPSSGAMQLKLSGLGIDPQGSTFQSAMSACQSKNPGGGMMIQGGSGGGR